MKKRFLSFLSFAGEKLQKQNWTKIALLFILIWSVRHVNKEYWQNENKWQETVRGDGSGYYAYLPASFIYQDYSFRFLDSIQHQYPSQGMTGNCGFCNISDGKTVNKYFCGEAVAISPFFLIADTITRATDYRRDGYSYLYMIFVSIAAIAYAFLGLFCIARLLARMGIRNPIIAIVIAAIYFGTNLFHYTVWSSAYSHVYSFAFISLFVLQIHRLCEKYSTRNLLLASFAFGMIVIIRPVNALIVLSIPFIAGNGTSLNLFFSGIFRRPFFLLCSVLLFAAIVFIQLSVYKIQTGHWYVYAYGKEGFDFGNPHIFKALFSYNAGMFVYAPVLLFSIAGLVILCRKEIFRAISFLVFIIIAVWIISSWWAWNYSGTYGMRPLVEYYALFAVLIAVFLNALKRKMIFVPVGLLILFLIILVQVQTWQFQTNMIAWDGMTKESYWRVFMRTGKQFEFINEKPVALSFPVNAKPVFSVKIDFERPTGSMDWRSVKKTLCTSGTQAVYFGAEDYHPPIWKRRISEYIPDSILAKGNLGFEIRAQSRLENINTNALLIYDFQDKNGIYSYADQYLIHHITRENEWTDFRWTFSAPGQLKADDVSEIYITKNDPEIMYLDDLTIIVWQW